MKEPENQLIQLFLGAIYLSWLSEITAYFVIAINFSNVKLNFNFFN